MQCIEESEEFGCLGDAIASLQTVPQEYLDRDLRITSASDDHDNSTLNYGPDKTGNLYAIKHVRKLHWFSHKCRAIVWKGLQEEVQAESRAVEEAAMHDWLAKLGIDELLPVFMSKGWHSNEQLQSMKTSGLTDQDLDFLDIQEARHRAVLRRGRPKGPIEKIEWSCFQKGCSRAFGSRAALQQHCNDTGHVSANLDAGIVGRSFE